MGKLIYSAIASLNGYVADAAGNFGWAEPDEKVHAFINDFERPVGTYLYGRRLYEVMAAWETMDVADQPPFIQDFAAIWRAADKVVFSRTLETVTTARTRIEREFKPAVVREMKSASARDMILGGPSLGVHAFKAGLIDECHLFVVPILVEGGKPAFADDVRLNLELLDERRFGNGMVHLHYRTRRPATPAA